MKYNENNAPIICWQKHSTCWRNTREMTVKGILTHSVGCQASYISRFVQPGPEDPNYDYLMKLLGKNKYNNSWNQIEHQAGLNAWIGKLADGTVATVQSMPWNYRPWGCGAGSKGSCNNGFIQWECCEDDLTNPTFFSQIYNESVELAAYLCKMYNIDPFGFTTVSGVKVPTITCHYEASQYGLAGCHADVFHWWPKFGKYMNEYRQDIYNKMHEQTQPEIPAPPKEDDNMLSFDQFKNYMTQYRQELQAKPVSDWAKEDVQWAVDNGIIQGNGENNLMPQDLLTREQAAALFHRVADMLQK